MIEDTQHQPLVSTQMCTHVNVHLYITNGHVWTPKSGWNIDLVECLPSMHEALDLIASTRTHARMHSCTHTHMIPEGRCRIVVT